MIKRLQFLLLILAFTSSGFAQETQEKAKTPKVPLQVGDGIQLPDNPPQTAEEFYDYAEKLWRKTFGRGSAGQVLEYLDRAIALEPGFSEAFYFRGYVKSRVDKYEESIADLARSLEIDPDGLDAYELRAEVKIKQKDFKGALADYDNFITRLGAKNQFTVRSLEKRGKLRYFLGNYDGAIEDFSTIISSGRSSDQYFLRGATYLKKGDKLAALDDFKKSAESLDYIFRDSVKNYPEVYAERKGYPRGENPLAVLIKSKPESEGEASTAVGVMVVRPSVQEQGDIKVQETIFPEFEEKLILENWFDLNSGKHYSTLMISDESSVIYYHYGLLLVGKGSSKEAEDSFTKSLSYNSEGYKNSDAWFQRGKIRLNDNRFEPAVRDFSWAISQNGALKEAYLERGIAILMLGHDSIAQKDFDFYLKFEPNAEGYVKERIEKAKKRRDELRKNK